MVQLADWITKLEPTLTQVWTVQAWNMAYNISVKFPNKYDRWRWVQRGIELLRDDGLRYNPREALMYRELAWFFQHKMGQNMDEAHMTYKEEWAKQMTNVLGSGRPNFNELINPSTEEARARAERLRQQYKMDPRIMKTVDDLYGPLEWRLPEAHAIYWAQVGLTESKKKELITLRRVVYQSMQMSVMHGRVLSMSPFRLGPDLTKVAQANAAFELMIHDDTEMQDAIKRAHRNFLKEAIYVLYSNNKIADASRWFKHVRELYPDAVPPEEGLDEFALKRLNAVVEELSRDKTEALITGMVRNYYLNLILDDDDRALGYELFARKLWSRYAERIKGQEQRLSLTPLSKIKEVVRDEFFDPKSGVPPEALARLRTKLNLPAPAAEDVTAKR
jgi:hypothetical protein